MSVRVVLPNAFQKHTNGAREMQSAAQNLPQLITEIEASFPALKPHLRDEDVYKRQSLYSRRSTPSSRIWPSVGS